MLAFVDESFREQYIILVILAVGQFVNVLTGNVGLLLSMTGFEKLQRNILLCSLFFSTLIGVVLIKSHGPVGAAVMVTFNTIFVNLTSYFFVLTKVRINTLKVI
ncbi:hypothetical protein JF50_04095 [Pseudoalteromonas luteoviolacea]|uniref:Polysaccharide biosynthesis protein C-terminal domain-containing protein n=1 Tax=Pseudoalteromonas luteoviolacea TaxID=43657 RepID=A0A0C1MSV3_9GAMM|nr:hypothetical protein JF50_04095 [Pseudoalteromonas luteoviolacea]